MAIERDGKHTGQPASDPADEAKLERIVGQAKTFLQSSKGRVVVCACGAAVVLLAVILLAFSIGRDTRLEGWPTGERMEGIQPPEQGRVVSVRETEDAVTVYLAEFPAGELSAYLKTLGASPAGDSTYVAQKGEDRILAVVYDPATKRLSLTVTSTM